VVRSITAIVTIIRLGGSLVVRIIYHDNGVHMAARYVAITTLLALTATACDKNPVAPDQTCEGLDIAPQSARVDLARPSFSNPTSVTNPLFPVSALGRVVLLGNVDGAPFRVETTLLSETRSIDVNGARVETLTSQYVAWVDRRLHEVALDWYAQDNGGAVWYFGEDVFNYEDGVVADTDGTWLGGREGPAAMIMPANPQVGQVWRSENVCGVVFEEVTMKTAAVTVPGPRGQVTGAIVTEELHMDNTRENKIFAPGYGEFSTGNPGGDLEAVALAVPTDALPGPASLDLQLRHRPRADIDMELLDLWARQLLIDAAAGNRGAVLGDAATLKWIRDRIAVDARPDLDLIDARLRAIGTAARATDPGAVSAAAVKLRHTLAAFESAG